MEMESKAGSMEDAKVKSRPDGWAGEEGLRLLAACSRLAERPDIVSGAGGNASWKCDDGNTFLLKASGARIEDAGILPILVHLDLPASQGDVFADGWALSAMRRPSEGGMRPSIEAALHAVLTDRAVLHVHSSAAVSLAIRPDAEIAARAAWKDFSVGFVPYARPGTQLAKALSSARAEQGRREIWLLGGHGAVFCAETPNAVVELALAAQEKVALVGFAIPPPRPLPSPKSGWRLLSDPIYSIFSTHPFGRKLLMGPCVPDQAVFLPPESIEMHPSSVEGALVSVDVDGAVFLSGLASSEAESLLLSLAHALWRIPASIPPVELPVGEAAALGGWEAERFRVFMALMREGRT